MERPSLLISVFDGPSGEYGRAGMTNDVFVRAVERMMAGRLGSQEQFVGCSEEEIRQVEAAAGGTLPATYRSFLATLGRSAGEFMRGTDFLFPRLLSLRQLAESLLRQCGQRCLRPEEFVFMSHQGYQFLFFDRLAGDDPPVFLFLEGDPEPRQVFSEFSGWLTGCVGDELGEN
jgi:hypothetical protein